MTMVLKRLFTRGFGLVLTVLCTVVLSAPPALAGSYNVYPEPGSGTISVTYPGFSSSDPLTSPDVSQFASGGTVAISFTETWRYSWEPEDEYEDDFPVGQVYGVSGSVQWDLTTNSASWYAGGTSTGEASMGSSTASATMTCEEGGYISHQENCGTPQQLFVEEFLSGWDGTFSITYSATMNLAPVMDGTITLTRAGTSVPVNKYIYITAPLRGSVFQGTQFSVTVEGVWKNPQTSTSGEYRVRWDPGNRALLEAFQYVPLVVYEPNVWNTWLGGHGYDPGGPYQINAALEYKDAAGIWLSGSTPTAAAWWSETRITVTSN